jgi:hypothetical protein
MSADMQSGLYAIGGFKLIDHTGQATMNGHTHLEMGVIGLIFLTFIGLGWWLIVREMRWSPAIGCFKLFALSHLFGGGCIIVFLTLHTALCSFSTTSSLFRDVEFLVRTVVGFLLCSMFIAMGLAARYSRGQNSPSTSCPEKEPSH